MPFIPHTPESLLPRSDSKNAATTCKGITSTGRPCRRPLGTSPQASPTPTRRSKNGVVAVLQPNDDDHDGAAAFFCWQHQYQANILAKADRDGRRADIVPLQQRTSIDTLAERLGVLDVEEDESAPHKNHKRHTRPARKETLPQKWQDMDGPLLAVPSEKQRARQSEKRKQRSRAESNLILSLFCCVRPADKDSAPPPRVRKQHDNGQQTFNEKARLPTSVSLSGRPKPQLQRYSSHTATVTASGNPMPHRTDGTSSDNGRPAFSGDRPSQTQDLLSLIPKSLSPQATSVLLAELAKPVSQHDEEGYIYMFWLTDAAANAPESGIASSLLADPRLSTPNGRRKSDILHAHAGASGSSKNTILLKIGRASNVQRRMNEWTRQCGYNLSLIRFYPYIPTSKSRPSTSTTPTSPSAPQKVLHAHKVERLIHLELAEQRVKRNCESCGKEHREWFEVDSSQEGVKRVDEVVRRWVGWGRRVGVA